MKSQLRVLGLAAIAAASLSACGSTISASSIGSANNAAAGALGTSGTSTPQSGAATQTPQQLAAADGAQTVAGTTGGANAGTSSDGQTDFGGPVTGGGSGSAASNGPGVTATKIAVGLAFPTDGDAYEAALGNTTSTIGQLPTMFRAVAADINKHGGVAGRQFDPYIHDYRTTDGSTDEIASAACADFTQDHKVFIGAPLATTGYLTCMQRAGAVSIGASTALLSDADFAQFPSYYDVAALTTDRASTNLASYLVAHDFFAKWDTRNGAPGSAPVKVGVIAPDSTGWVNVTPKVLVPALERLGVKINPADIRIWHFPDGASGDASAVSQIQAMVLRMRSDGVTHIIPTEINSLTFFAAGAETQGYRPRYAITSASGVNSQAGGLLPYRQLGGAMGIGWAPVADLPDAYNPDNGPYAGPNRAHCLAVLKAAGVTFKTPTEEANGLVICDALYSAAAAINAIPHGSPITRFTFMTALEHLGNAFKSSALKTATYALNRHYPASTGYELKYDPPCKCARYFGSPFTLS